MKFPLPYGHSYGYRPHDVTVHDGYEDWDFEDRRNIGFWQRQVARTIERDLTVTYRFDGPTQRAAIAVQSAHGLPLSGMIDVDTWNVVWAQASTAPETPLESPQSDEQGLGVHGQAPETSGDPEGSGAGLGGLLHQEETLPQDVDASKPPDTPKRGRPRKVAPPAVS